VGGEWYTTGPEERGGCERGEGADGNRVAYWVLWGKAAPEM